MTVEEANKEFLEHNWEFRSGRNGVYGGTGRLCAVRVTPYAMPDDPELVDLWVYVEGRFCTRVPCTGDYAKDVGAIAEKVAKYHDGEEWKSVEAIGDAIKDDDYPDIYYLLEDVCKKIEVIRAIKSDAEALAEEAEKARK